MSQPSLWQSIDRLPVGTAIQLELPTRRSIKVIPLQESVFSAASKLARAASLSEALSTEQAPVPSYSDATAMTQGSAEQRVKAITLKMLKLDRPGLHKSAFSPAAETARFRLAAETAHAAGTSLAEELLKANGWDPTAQRPVPVSSTIARIPQGFPALTVKLDPVGLKERVEALLRAVTDQPQTVAAVSKAKDATGAAKYICDVFTLNYPGAAPAFQAPVAGLAVIASAADFWQEWASHKFRGARLMVKGAVLMIDAADFAGIVGVIPNSGIGLKSTGLLLRAADKMMAVYQD
jgi:hypothetical protein